MARHFDYRPVSSEEGRGVLNNVTAKNSKISSVQSIPGECRCMFFIQSKMSSLKRAQDPSCEESMLVRKHIS